MPSYGRDSEGISIKAQSTRGMKGRSPSPSFPPFSLSPCTASAARRHPPDFSRKGEKQQSLPPRLPSPFLPRNTPSTRTPLFLLSPTVVAKCFSPHPPPPSCLPPLFVNQLYLPSCSPLYVPDFSPYLRYLPPCRSLSPFSPRRYLLTCFFCPPHLFFLFSRPGRGRKMGTQLFGKQKAENRKLSPQALRVQRRGAQKKNKILQCRDFLTSPVHY